MGMSASQARLLAITARLNDVEYKSQNIANIKIRLADESEQLAMKYTAALNQQKYTLTSYDENGEHSVDLRPDNLSAYGYELVKVGTNTTVTRSDIDSVQMYNMIQSGEYILRKKSDQTEVTASNQVNLNETFDKSNWAKAEAEYNAANMKINNKEKQLDNEMKKLDTEHNALQTESDSIKNLIGKNIEKSFNLFS